MSSSDDRRRPRVAGHRRRPSRPPLTPPAGHPAVDTPVTAPDAVETPSTARDAVGTPSTAGDAVGTPSTAGDAAGSPMTGADAVPAPSATSAGAASSVTSAGAASPEPDVPHRDPERDPEGTPADRGPGTTRRGGLRRDLVAPLVALVLAVVALAVVGAVSLQDPGARGRDARAATAAARADLEQLLSYDHGTIAVQADRNAALLTGPFKAEYATTMRTKIAPVAQKEKAVVRARSYEAGVMSQGDDSVTVQVFLNQAKTSQGQEQPSVDQNRVIATMQRVGGRWLIARLSAY